MSGLSGERVEEAVTAMEAAQIERYGVLIPEMSPDEAMDALAPLVAGWLAQAWDEGSAAPRMVDGSELPAIDNPYRADRIGDNQ